MEPSAADTQHQLQLMQTIFGLVSRHELSVDEQLTEILKLGSNLFHEQIAIISRIKGRQYTVDYVYAPGFDIKKGQIFDLDNTICSTTINAHKVVCVDHAIKPKHRHHPCIASDIQSYIGTAITINGQIYGTLSFSSVDPKTESFLDNNPGYIETLGEWVASLIGYTRLVNKIGAYAHRHTHSGLLNESAFMEKLERCIDRSSRSDNYSFAVLSIDTENSQPRQVISDDSTESVENENLTKCIQKLIRPRDSIGYRGNNEFIILLEDVMQSVLAKKIAFRIEKNICETLPGSCTSIGAVINNGTDGTEVLLSKARQMMHIAKEDGGGVCIFE